MILKNVCILIPGLTSILRCAPAYELPLFTARTRQVSGDADALPRTISFPVDLPITAQSKTVNSMEFEITRLRMEFGDELFNACYASPEHFERVFKEAIIDGKAIFEAAQARAKAVKQEEELVPATSEEMTALANLNVDGLTGDIATKLASHQLADIRMLAATPISILLGLGLSKILATNLLEAAKAAAPMAPLTLEPDAPNPKPSRMTMHISAPASL